MQACLIMREWVFIMLAYKGNKTSFYIVAHKAKDNAYIRFLILFIIRSDN